MIYFYEQKMEGDNRISQAKYLRQNLKLTAMVTENQKLLYRTFSVLGKGGWSDEDFGVVVIFAEIMFVNR